MTLSKQDLKKLSDEIGGAMVQNLSSNDSRRDAIDKDQFERESHCPLYTGKGKEAGAKPEPKVGPSPFRKSD